ncbi:MAG TPA: ACT domain-containing protein [Methanocorpusculum sp.]|nr:ACT domain-containing protein [Methanocorpusculum sp.]
MEKVIITVVGRDTVGIIARICTCLSDNHVNVEDISQTIVQGYFNMMMIVNSSKSSLTFEELATAMDTIGTELGMKIHCQREEIFDRMHRI